MLRHRNAAFGGAAAIRAGRANSLPPVAPFALLTPTPGRYHHTFIRCRCFTQSQHFYSSNAGARPRARRHQDPARTLVLLRAGAARFGRRKPGNPLPWYAAPSNRRPPTGEKERAHRGGCTLTVIDRGKNLSRQQYLAVLAEQRNCGGPSPIRSSSISRSRLRASARRACGCGRSSCPRSSTTGGRRLSARNLEQRALPGLRTAPLPGCGRLPSG